MVLRLFNTLTKSKEDFVPLDPKNVRLYVCGPTVYDYAHIGNARPVIVFDVLYRLLRHLYGEAHVTYVRNITDVDDKINARAAEEGVSIRELTEKTAAQFHADVAALGCLPPTHEPRATEYIAPMIAMIETLIASGHAYAADGHVLYDVSSKPDYGKLSRRSVNEMIAGARVEIAPYKKNPMDFVLWKPSPPELPGWDSPWGRGRPGWHIECSAMSGSLLGESFDIHGGGIDLQFPHHENEIAQSEGAHGGGTFAKIWMHNGFLQVEGQKMSKSLGNFFTIHDLLNEYPGGAIKLAMLQTHYRQPLNWTADKVVEAWRELGDWTGMLYGSLAEHQMNMRNVNGNRPAICPEVAEALHDDLNTPQAISVLRQLFKDRHDQVAYARLVETCEALGLVERRSISSYPQFIRSTNLGPDRTFPLFDKMKRLKVAFINRNNSEFSETKQQIERLGIGVEIHYDGAMSLHQLSGPSAPDSGEIVNLIAARNNARKAKNFAESDRIRDELLEKGIVLKDGPDGTTWEVKR